MTLTTLTMFHAFCTLGLTGLVWFVQLVHYPLLGEVGQAERRAYAAAHRQRTTWLVAPTMVGEASAAGVLVFRVSGASATTLTVVGLVLLLVIWLSTALIQVPLHRQLARRLQDEDVRRLTRSNWIRTLAWSARSVIALALVRALMHDTP